MSRRKSSSTWLNLRAGLGDLILQEHHQTYSQFNAFTYPQKQFPQMLMFIGGQIKSLALRKLRFQAQTQEIFPDEVHLRVVSGNVNDQWPLLIADCEMHNASQISKANTDAVPGNITQRSLTWHRLVPKGLDPASIAHLLYSKLLAPFSTVICFFADDFGGLVDLARLLAVWLVTLSNRPSDLPFDTHPRVLILQTWHDRSTFDEQVATKKFMMELGREAEKKIGVMTENQMGKLKKAELDRLLAQQFGGMRVLAIPHVDCVSRAWSSFKSRIIQDSNDIQIKRRDAQVAFSVRHFKAFFSLACEHFCNEIVSPFNFIRASRIHNPVPEDLAVNLTAFLELVDHKQLLNFAAIVIGSALAFDSYPPGMHAFNPILVFRQLFYQICLNIYPPRRQTNPRDKSSSVQLLNGIERAFCQFAYDLINSDDCGLSAHQMTLAKFKDQWRNIYSNKICFSCFGCQPESSLECHHSLCTFCTRAHGKTTPASPWVFMIEQCPFCQQENTILFPQKPDTAGVRALIVEGGGTRGIIPLTFLEKLQREIGLQQMDVQEHFDIAFGNSAGALIILGLYSNNWTVEDCIKNFLSLADSAFRKRFYFKLPFISSRLMQVLLSFITDSKYSSGGINSALKSVYGQKSLFELPAFGTKVAVIATTTDDSSTCLLANYNGPRKRASKCGYRVIRPEDSKKELLTWEAGRASSAAPPYFKSFQGYQDGGLGGHNNPINLALWEQDVIWSRSKKQPDVVVSLGTGFKRNSEETTEDRVENLSFFQSRYPPRLLRSFLNFFDGEVRWQELQNSLLPQDRNRYHRMNIEFHGPEPELDDLEVIPSLQQQARCQASSHKEIQQCADNILASLFYLELDGLPEFDQSSFACYGRICCRLGPSHPAMRSLMTRLAEARFYLNFQQWIPCIDPTVSQIVEAGGPFTKHVSFRVADLEHSIDIKIDGIIQRARSISNCPYVVRTLIQDQGLDCPFGSRRLKRRGESLSGPEPKRRLKQV